MILQAVRKPIRVQSMDKLKEERGRIRQGHGKEHGSRIWWECALHQVIVRCLPGK